MYRIFQFVLFASAFLIGSIPTVQAESQRNVTEIQFYQTIGSSHYSKWGISVYDATLKAPDGVFSMDKPFSLTLTYKLGLNGQKIAAQARKEMVRQNIADSQLNAWEKQLASLIPNVKKGDTLTGFRTAKSYLILLKNGTPVGELKDPALTNAFFSIWLGETTSEPEQRKRLLGK